MRLQTRTRLNTSIFKTSRNSSTKSDRRNRNRSQRRIFRSNVRVLIDDDGTREIRLFSTEKTKQVASNNFSHWINWLDKQVGRGWNDIWSDICRMTDPRSLSGHIIRQYISSYTSHAPDKSYNHYGPYVDENGILQTSKNVSRFKLNPEYKYFLGKEYKQDKITLENLLQNHKIRQIGTKLFWFEPVNSNTSLTLLYDLHYRQSRELTADERRIFESINPILQQDYLSKN